MPGISCSRLLQGLDIVSFSIPPHLTFNAGTPDALNSALKIARVSSYRFMLRVTAFCLHYRAVCCRYSEFLPHFPAK